MSLEGFPQQADDDSSISDTESSLHGHGPACQEGAPPTVTQQQAEELCYCQQVHEDSGNEKKVCISCVLALITTGCLCFLLTTNRGHYSPRVCLFVQRTLILERK